MQFRWPERREGGRLHFRPGAARPRANDPRPNRARAAVKPFAGTCNEFSSTRTIMEYLIIASRRVAAPCRRGGVRPVCIRISSTREETGRESRAGEIDSY